MLAHRAQPVGHRCPRNHRFNRRMHLFDAVIEQLAYRPFRRTKRQHAIEPLLFRMAVQPRELGVIHVQHGDTARHAIENRRLLIGDCLDIFEMLQMHRFHRGDHRHIRLRHARQRADFTRMVHAHFDDGELHVARHIGQRQRHAEMIVEVARRRIGAPQRRQRRQQHFLGARFTHAARHAYEFRLAARPCRHAKRLQRLLHIGYQHQLRGIHPIHRAAYQRGCRALVDGLLHIIMPVHPLASQRHEQRARLQRARVNAHTRCLPMARAGAAGGCNNFARFPCGGH